MKQHELDELTARIRCTLDYILSGQSSPAPVTAERAAEAIAATVSVWLMWRETEKAT